MKKIYFLLFILIIFTNYSKAKPATPTSLLAEPIATNRRDTLSEDLIPNPHLTAWVAKFDRKLLEVNSKELLEKFAAAHDLIKNNTTLLPLSYCGIYAAISSAYPDF